jgi:hypothetical protein
MTKRVQKLMPVDFCGYLQITGWIFRFLAREMTPNSACPRPEEGTFSVEGKVPREGGW